MLSDVIITSDLQERPSREIDLQRENNAFRELADHLASDQGKFLERLVELALMLCGAGTVGITAGTSTPDWVIDAVECWLQTKL